jgi:taurine dioxygenase
MVELRIEPVGPSMGAEISGIDLSEPLSSQNAEAIRKAFLDYQVIFFHDQDLTAPQFKALGEVFGDAYPHFFARNLGGDLQNINIISGDEDSRIRGTADRHVMFHSDGSYFEYPTGASLLLGKKIPSLGGDTLFVNMYDAYDTLHPALQRACEELQILHTFPNFTKSNPQGLNPKYFSDHPGNGIDEGSLNGRLHPLVIVHPETGRKALNVNRQFANKIADMHETQARQLLNLLVEHCTSTPEFQFRFQWKTGSIAIWDNRCTLHTPIKDYSVPREMWRITIHGTKPLQGVAPELESVAA